MKKSWITGVALLCSVAITGVANSDDAAPAPTDSHGVRIQYAGQVLIFQVANISITGEFQEDTYAATSRFTAAGLAALFTDADIEASVSGYRTGSSLEPWHYSHLNHASSKNRTVAIDFPDGVAMPDINPPFGNMGDPAATDEDRAGAMDPISTLLAMGLGAVETEDGICDGRLPVFDGRARYNLRFENGGSKNVRTRAWRGEAIICHAYYEPISGYEADEFPSDEDISEPISFWLAPINDGTMYIPVKIRSNAGFGGVTVTATSMETW